MFMTGKEDSISDSRRLSVTTHFARQLKKTRLQRRWSLDDLARATGVNAGHWSRVENGKRPPTAALAAKADQAFPEKGGWFSDWYRESQSWSEMAAFRDWPEYEDTAPALLVWETGVIPGLLQTEAYARALLTTSPDASPEEVAARLASRMQRQQRVLFRDNPPNALFLVDEVALYRLVGSAGTMAEQMRRLLTVAALPHVTLQAVPLVAHPANASGFIIAGDAAYAEHVAEAFTYTDERLAPFLRLFDTLRGECRRVSETTALIERMCESWTMTGGSRPTPMPTEGTA